MKLLLFSILFIILFSSCSSNEDGYQVIDTEKIALGKEIFNDKNLSNPIGQACASCHSPEKGFSDLLNSAVSQGAVANAFGNRNAPSLSYNVFSPSRYFSTEDNTFIGGLFLDGRSPNLQEQFIHPLLNPVEMNNSSASDVANKIKQASYYLKIVSLYSNSVFESDILSYVADALSKFETSNQVNPFTSKYDYYLQGRATLSLEEKKGLALFEGKAKCAGCHVTDPDENVKKVLFTDFSYDNIGIPKNLNNPFYNQPSNSAGANYVDLGIGAIVSEPAHYGKFRVPTLRNIAVSAPYFHNGVFNTLEEVIHFYNKRLVENLGTPEYNTNVNIEELGDLKLTLEEERKLKVFLETLTDHYRK